MCKDGFFWLNENCHECPSAATSAGLAIAAAFLATLICGLIYCYTDGKMDTSTKLKIACNHFQVSVISYSFKLRYPDIVLRVVNIALSIVSFVRAFLLLKNHRRIF